MRKTRKALTFWAESCPTAPAGKDALEALKEVDATDEIRALLRGMFSDGSLDPYPTSDAAPNYKLRKWCGWRKST